jgi:hypothetical protein
MLRRISAYRPGRSGGISPRRSSRLTATTVWMPQRQHAGRGELMLGIIAGCTQPEASAFFGHAGVV